MLFAMALLIVIVFAAVYPVIPWQRVFNVKSRQAIQEAGPAMAVFIACFAASLPLGVVQQVQLGYQEGFINGLWESAGRVLGLAGLLLVIYLRAGLVWLVLASLGHQPWLGCSTIFSYLASGARGCAPDGTLSLFPVPKGFSELASFFFSCKLRHPLPSAPTT